MVFGIANGTTIEESAGITSRFNRLNYDVELYIDNQLIPCSQLTGTLSYNKTSGQATTLEFTILNLHGLQDPESYIGRRLTGYIHTHEGRFKFFTGWVNNPSIDLIEEKTTLSCSDRRSFRIKNLTETSATFPGVSGVGQYSSAIFGQPKDQLDELDRRLQTIPYDFDFDNNGVPQLTPWLPKSVADFTLTDAPGPYYDNKIYYDKPEVTFSDPASRINTFKVTFSHNYTRLVQVECGCNWAGYNDLRQWYFGTGIGSGYPQAGRGSFPAKSTIEGAAGGGNWAINGKINFVELWPAQGIVNGDGGVIIWQPNQITQTTEPKKDINGNVVKDSNGNVQTTITSSTITDTSTYLCRGASWTAIRKFAQPIVENFNLTMYSSSSIDQFNDENITEESYNVVSEYDAASWTNDNTLKITGTGPKYIDQRTNLSNVQSGLQIAINKGKVAIMKSHRDCEVSFNRSIFPQVDVTHTIELNAGMIKCRGRVTNIVHAINFSTGEAITSIKLTLSRCKSQDSMTPTFISPIINDNYSYLNTNFNVYLGTHLGLSELLRQPYMNGWFGNCTNTERTANNISIIRTSYSEQFVVDYPEVPESMTAQRDIYSNYDFSVNIPNDYLEIRSDVYS
jgi:hypothetical protein